MALYNLLGYRFAAEIESCLGRRLIDRLYTSAREPVQGAGLDRFTLDRVTDRGLRGWRVNVNDQFVCAEASLGAALRLLEYEICQRVIAHRPELIVLHGALVCRAGRAALLIGRSGAGKTTLALALTSRGLHVLTDDIVLLDPATNTLAPLPRCFHLEAGTAELLHEVGVVLAGEGVEQGFITPADLGADPGCRHTLRCVVALADDPSTGESRPLTQAEAAVRLLDEAGWSSAHGDAPLAALAALLAPTSCVATPRRALADMIDTVCSLDLATEQSSERR